jgi:hypothetical protein
VDAPRCESRGAHANGNSRSSAPRRLSRGAHATTTAVAIPHRCQANGAGLPNRDDLHELTSSRGVGRSRGPPRASPRRACHAGSVPRETRAGPDTCVWRTRHPGQTRSPGRRRREAGRAGAVGRSRCASIDMARHEAAVQRRCSATGSPVARRPRRGNVQSWGRSWGGWISATCRALRLSAPWMRSSTGRRQGPSKDAVRLRRVTALPRAKQKVG